MMRIAGAVACIVLGASSVVGAQDRTAVRGVVRDSANGEPLAGALVDLRSVAYQRATRSNQQGEFRLGDVPRGEFHVTVRRLGYAEVQRDVRVADGDTSLVFAMSAIARALDARRVVARVNGIQGVVGSAHAMQPLANATVQVVGLGRPVRTDSAGRFFVEIRKGGSYLVRIAHDGYAHQVLTIDVPGDGAVETSVLLDSTTTREWAGTKTLWEDFDKRIIWRGAKSALVSASELEKLSGMSLGSALNASRTAFRRGLVVGPNTCVFVNGLPRPGLDVDGYPPERVAAVELYGARGEGTGTLGSAWPSRAPCGSAQGGPYGAGVPAGNAQYAVIWLKP